MLNSLFKLLDDYNTVTPRYTGQRCLSEKLVVGGCDLCQVVCPHGAVSVMQGAVLDPNLCTGCGLCVQACPTGALEYDVTGPLGALKEARSENGGPGEARLVCSKSEEQGKTVPCLGRLTESAVVAAGAWDTPLTLVHGDCEGCSLGGPSVPASVERVIAGAQRLREATGRPARVTLRRADPALSVPEQVNRRGMFGALAKGARGVVAQSLPESPLPFVDWSEPKDRVPADWGWRLRALRPKPGPETPVHWPAPTVDSSCIDCPVCANVCPTEAITREVQPDGRVTLVLQLDACTGCDACTKSCPPQAITLMQEWPGRAFDTPLLLREGGSVLG